MFFILFVLPIGATEVRFTLVGSGLGSRLAIIDYLWPPIVFEIENLFAEEIKQGKFANFHPKIIALKEDLKFTREYLSEAPKGFMNSPFPFLFKRPVTQSNAMVKKEKTEARL